MPGPEIKSQQTGTPGVFYNPYGDSDTSPNSVWTQQPGFGTQTQPVGGGGNARKTNNTSDPYALAIQKIRKSFSGKQINISDTDIKNLIISTFGKREPVKITTADINDATNVIIETIKYLEKNSITITLDSIVENLGNVRLAMAAGIEPGSVSKYKDLDERLNKIMKDEGLNSEEDALKRLFIITMDKHNNDGYSLIDNGKTWLKNARRAFVNGETKKAFRSVEETRQVEANQTIYSIIISCKNNPDKLAKLQRVLTELANEYPETFGKYAKTIGNAQIEMLARGGQKVYNEMEPVATFPEEIAPKIEDEVAKNRDEQSSIKANKKLDKNVTHLEEILKKLKENKPLTDEDYKVLAIFNIYRDTPITTEIVQSKLNGFVANYEAAQSHGACCNENLSKETRDEIIYNNIRHENGENVVKCLEGLIEETPDTLVISEEEVIHQIETINNTIPRNIDPENNPNLLNNPSSQIGGECSISSSSTLPDSGGSGQGYSSYQPQQGSLGFEQYQAGQPQQTMSPRDLYSDSNEQGQITLVKPQKGGGLGAILKKHTGNLSELIDKHIKDSGVLGFLREALNCKGAMDIKYIRDKVLQLFNSMTTSLRINMFNSVLNNESSTILLAELDNNELNTVKAQNSYVKSQIDLAKKHREERQGTSLT